MQHARTEQKQDAGAVEQVDPGIGRHAGGNAK